ncbi:MAG: putative HNH endonuclease [Microviridae sp.]|nr:MAG: putative HNH endonuclease [Microviridae sp.]
MADVKKPEAVKPDPAVLDLEEAILGKEEFAKRRAAFPQGIARVVKKLTEGERASIRAVKHVKNAELAKHFGVSVTTIANIRKLS